MSKGDIGDADKGKSPRETSKLFVKQEFPPLGKEAFVVKAEGSHTLELPVKVFRKGQVKLTANFVVIVAGRSHIALEVKRGCKSITNGPQILLSTLEPSPTAITTTFVQTLTFTIVDTLVEKGKHLYSFVITNLDKTLPRVSFSNYSLIAKSLLPKKTCCKKHFFASETFRAVQAYPPLGTPSLELGPGFASDIPDGDVRVRDGFKIKLEANLGMFAFSPSSTNFSMEILRNEDSLTGAKSFLNFQPPFPIPGAQTFNFDFVYVDIDPLADLRGCKGKAKYTLRLRNESKTDSVQITFSSFSADLIPRTQRISQLQVFKKPVEVDANKTVSFPLDARGRNITFNLGVNLPTNTGVFLYNIRRKGEKGECKGCGEPKNHKDHKGERDSHSCQSLVSGNRMLFRNIFTGFSSSETQVVNLDVNVVDESHEKRHEKDDRCHKRKEETRYIVDFSNQGIYPVTLNYVAFIAE